MSLPAGYRGRPVDRSDLDAIVALFRATDLVDAGVVDPVRDHIEDEWREPGFDLEKDSRLVLGDDGTAAAYAVVTGLNPQLSLDAHVRVHPEHRGRGLGTALLAWGQARAFERSPRLPKLYAATAASDETGHRLLERTGFAYARTFWHMERELDDLEPWSPPDAIEIRGLRSEDVRPLWLALEEAFADHWGFEPFPYELHEDEMRRLDHALVAVATYDDEIVGGVTAEVVQDGVGWIGVLGVRPGWRGRGIATALLRRQFEALAARAAPRAMLNVDAENTTGATRLYTAVGMRVRRAFDLFEKRFPDG